MHRGMRERRRDTRTERPPEELHANRKKVLIGGGVVVLALAAMGKIGLPGPSIHIDTDAPRKGAAVVEAQQVYDAYRDDPASAAKRFHGRAWDTLARSSRGWSPAR